MEEVAYSLLHGSWVVEGKLDQDFCVTLGRFHHLSEPEVSLRTNAKKVWVDVIQYPQPPCWIPAYPGTPVDLSWGGFTMTHSVLSFLNHEMSY